MHKKWRIIYSIIKQELKNFYKIQKKQKKVLDEAMKKADEAKGPLEKVWDNLQLMFNIVHEWMKGDYKEIPIGSIVAIVCAILYFVSPIDVIPDFIPVAVYIDDIFVVSLVIGQVRSDLHEAWKVAIEN
jgi:uncharacterized membrane protein YkvA (DUF1232 family)